VEDRVQLANSSFVLNVESEARAELEVAILMEENMVQFVRCRLKRYTQS
jgi:hypothetical protein